MDPLYLQHLICRCRDGTATPNEHQELETYWAQSLAHQQVIDDLKPAERQALQDRLYQQTLRQIQQQEPGAFRPVRALWSRTRLAVAASLTALLLTGALAWYWPDQTTRSTVAVQTDFGQRKRVVLPEGSVVWLNGHSSLRYAVDSLGNRQAWLTGEALFSVQHTATHRKFVVHTTNHLNIEVLGTVFNVTDRRGSVSVVLRSGSVRVRDQMHRQPDVLLKPGEMVSQTDQTPALAKTPIQAEPRIAWKDGHMYVENKPLGELFDWIEDTYGLEIECPAALRSETFAGTVPTDSIEPFFTVIGKLYQVQVQQDGKTYRLTKE